MKKYKNIIFYTGVLTFFIFLIYFIIHLGQENLVYGYATLPESDNTAWSNFIYNLGKNIFEPLAILLLQIVVILFAVRIFGWLCQKIGQPNVVGEIIAGVVLGPSLLGLYFPEISNFIFPEFSLSNINILSQIGLILFMFIVGLELDLKTIKNKANDAVIISHTSIVVTYALGVTLAYFLFGKFTHKNTEFFPFALFMGIAMSIAAFPVMARIVHERGINKTPLGPTIITCAAIDDITAWCLLATVIAISKAGSFGSSIFVILLAIAYIIFMFKVVRPFLKRVTDMQTSKRVISKSMLGVFFIVLFLSAYATELIGIHALFGAFMAGVIMPSNISFRNLFAEKIEDVALILLLPLFFVFTGLRTHIGLLNEADMWFICGGIILLAVLGKGLGSAFAARFVGNSWKDSLTIGALMNTRGLMELVVLNIGLDLGILTPKVFAMMVVMALITTFMTSPLLSLIDKVFRKQEKIGINTEQKKFRILVSFDNSDMGRKLLYMANCFIRKKQSNTELTMLHLSEGNMLYQYGLDREEEDLFKPIMDEANSLNQNIITIFKVSSNINANVAKIANKGEYDLLLIGQKFYTEKGNVLVRMLGLPSKFLNILNYLLSLIGIRKKRASTIYAPITENARTILTKADIPVGIFLDKDIMGIRNVFVPILDEDDNFVGEFMERLAENSYVRITLWDAIGLSDNSIEFIKSVRAIKSVNPYLFQLWNNVIPIDSDIIKKQDLVMISLDSWKKLESKNVKWLKDMPSTLVLNK